MKYGVKKHVKYLRAYRIISMGLRGMMINVIEDRVIQWYCRWVFEDEDLAIKTLIKIPMINNMSDEEKAKLEKSLAEVRDKLMLEHWASFDLSDIEKED